MYSMLLAMTIPLENDAVSEPAPNQNNDAADIIIIGSRLSQPTEVISSNPDIDKNLVVDSLDYLNRLPDVRAVSTGGVAGNSFVSIRGAEPNFAQVLIDGVRVSNPSNSQGGGFDFALLDPAVIDNISIIPTSRTAVHGSDTLSGVVNIRLKEAPPDGATFLGSLGVDSEEARNASLMAGYGWADGGLTLSGAYYDSGELTQGSQLERGQLFARFRQDIGSWRLSSFLLYGEADRTGFPEASGGPILAANPAQEIRDSHFVVAGFNLQGDDTATIKPTLKIGYYDDNNKIDSPAIFPGVFMGVPALASDTNFDRLEITADARFRLTDKLALLAGANFLREQADSIGTIDFGFLVPTAFAITREQSSLFAETEWQATDGLKLSLAGRHDLLRGNSETTLQASVEYTIANTGLTFFGGYAEGFRRPSLFALAFPLTANPDLLPERSDSWETGVKWSDENTNLRFNLFRNEYSNLIDFDPMLFTTVNRSQTDITGFSMSGEGKIGQALAWNISLTHVDIDSDVPLRGRPDWFGQAGLIWQANNNLQFGTSSRFNSDLLESAIPTGVVELDGHVEFDIFAQWQLSEQITLNIATRNITDSDFKDAIGFPNTGRLVRARIQLAL